MTGKTGGAAFPVAYSNEYFIQEGATLRDYFAAKAMNGILSNHCMIDNVTEQSVVWVAKESYQMADAMLKARG